jgi:hypothetical protein
VYAHLGELLIDRATLVDTIVVCVTQAACTCLHVLRTKNEKVICGSANDQQQMAHADGVSVLSFQRSLTGLHEAGEQCAAQSRGGSSASKGW